MVIKQYNVLLRCICCRQAKVVDSVRVSKLRLFADYLCGVEPPLMSYDVERSCYVSAVTPLTAAATDSDKQQRYASELSDSEAKVLSTAVFESVRPKILSICLCQLKHEILSYVQLYKTDFCR